MLVGAEADGSILTVEQYTPNRITQENSAAQH